MFYTNVFSRGDKIYLRGYEGDRRISEIINYKPYLFIPARKESQSEYRSLDNKPVEKIDFDSITDARDFVKQYADVANMEIYGLTNFPYLFIYDKFHGEINYDVDRVNVISMDIETDSSGGWPDIKKADKEVTAITLSRKGEKIVLGMGDYASKDKNVTYLKCKDEWHLLSNFLKIWQSGRFAPDIVTGWNIEFFDIPYLVNRITNVLGRKEALKLSPWGFLDERTVESHGRENQTFNLVGINVLDYLALYRKFKFEQQESYKLDSIAEKELGVKKLDYSEYGSLNDLYVQNYEKFIDYNIHDTALIDMLEEKLKFIEQVIAFAYDAKVNYSDTMTTVRPWDVIIHNYLLDRSIVIHQFKKGSNFNSLIGGYVKEPKLGLSKWVVSFDLNSLYPHLIMQYNISAETFVERLSEFPTVDTLLNVKDSEMTGSVYSYAANGTVYSKRKQGFLPALMEKMYNDRVEYKNKMIDAKQKLETMKTASAEEKRMVANDIAKYHNLQLAKKIQLNSAYGALANPFFRWFNFDLSEAITMSGQLSIRWIEKSMNEYLNKVLKSVNVDYVIASDTDSIYVNMEPLAKMLDTTETQDIVVAIDKFCETKIRSMINRSYEDLAKFMNAYQQKMFMKRETIADKAIWKAKKMYILNAWNIEGVQYSEPQLKIQGIEAVRSSTPNVCRKAIKEALSLIMNKRELDVQKYISDFREKFIDLKFADVAFPRGMKGMDKYGDRSSIYLKGTPIHVKGALLYNDLVKRKGLGDKYQLISNGDKIKFAYLKIPNPLNDTVISVLDDLPSELGLDKYIDYETQFVKCFLDPIKNILDVIGWDTEKKSTLESFFS